MQNRPLTIRSFTGKIHPRDLKLSDVTATSAAALALYMGVYDVRTETVRKLQMVLGIHFGKALVSDPSEDVAGSTFSYCRVGFIFFALILSLARVSGIKAQEARAKLLFR